MLSNYIKQCVSGNGPLQAEIQLSPVDNLRIRPNVIFEIAEEKKVLHLGCTDHLSIIEQKLKAGIYLHRQLSYVSKKCLGVDINSKAAEYLSQHGISNIVIGDITEPGIKEIQSDDWDYLLMAEVLEHINNPVSFLLDIKNNYGKNIKGVIITVPNAFGWIHMNSVIYHGIESINSDHRFWFTPYTLCKVAHEAGLILDDLIMCIYENSIPAIGNNEQQLKQKPILQDTILLKAHW